MTEGVCVIITVFMYSMACEKYVCVMLLYFLNVCRYTRRVRSRMTLRRLRTPMYMARMKSYPPIPNSLTELTQALLQNPRISETVDGEENLYAGSVTATDGSHHVAFISPRMIEFLGKVKILQGDGTFRSRPAIPPSSQCFVLVTTWRNCVSL